MNRVLKQEATHEGGDCQELAIDEHAEGEATIDTLAALASSVRSMSHS